MKISVNGLGKRFNREWIFRNLTYTFETGNTYAITGPNGSGKSTLLQVLWGQMPPGTGEIIYLKDANTQIETEAIYRHIAIAAPYMDLIDEFTLDEQLRFHFRLKSVYGNLSHDQLPDALDLHHARNKFIGNFSSGMRQRLKLGLAFYTQSDILFLDEPGTNLDKQAFGWYLDLLAKLTPGRLVIIASNQPAEYPPYASKIDLMAFK